MLRGVHWGLGLSQSLQYQLYGILYVSTVRGGGVILCTEDQLTRLKKSARKLKLHLGNMQNMQIHRFWFYPGNMLSEI